MRPLDRAARAGLAQGRLRPRADRRRVARARPARRLWPALAALRSGAGLVTVATPASLPADRRRARRRVHDAAARRRRRRHRRRVDALDAVLGVRRRRDRRRARPRPIGQATARSCTRWSSACGVPLVLDADALSAFAGEPDRLVGRDGVDIDHHAASRRDGARSTGLSIDDVQAHRLGVARDFAATHRVHVVLRATARSSRRRTASRSST